MGVHGLWRLIEPAGKPVPLETLENKVLAVDVSIWLHQAIKGFQDSKGAPVPNAHLLGIYHRVTKLLYFKIKPIFIFDGGVPVLKKQTIARRNQLKSRNASEADRLQKQLLNTILKHSAINKVLSEKTKVSIAAHAKKSNRSDMYLLPLPEHDSTLSSSESEEDSSTTDTPDSSPTKHWDLHTIDMSSSHFKSLPIEVRHEILTDLKDTRKQSSWGRIQEIPKQSDDFSSYQMNRLLKRQSVQSALDQVALEMGGSSLSLAELEILFKDQGIPTTVDKGKRIASDENIKYFYIKDVKEAIDKARKEHLDKETFTKNDISSGSEETKYKTKVDQEEEEELQKAIALSLQEVPSTSEMSRQKLKLQFSPHDDRDFQSDSSCEELEIPSRTNTPDRIHNIISVKSNKEQNNPFDKNNSAEFEGDTIHQSKGDVLEDVIKVNDVEAIAGNKSVLQLQGISRDLQHEYNFGASKDKVSGKDVNKPSCFSIETPQYIKENILLGSNKDKSYMLVENTPPKHPDAIIKNNHIEEIMSDSSDSNDFMEVSNMEPIKDSVIEIEIDPSEEKEDDLFADIFDINETKSLKVGISTEKVGFSSVKEKKSSASTIDSLEMKANAFKLESKIVKDQSNAENKMQNSLLGDNEEKCQISEKLDKPYKQNQSMNINEEENCRMNKKSIDEDTVEKVEDAVIATVEPKLSLSEMEDLRNKLQIEKTDILVEKSVKERMAGNITDQMYEEAQELLELFGVPYIIAPMEAEAQCAFLDAMELTDGTITDDSDIWLFGGKTVYKNFFNQSKYVMEFRAENIQHHFKLSREQMILLALLVGSDYTTGIQGVGPVTALEILASFPPSQPTTELCLSHNELLSGLKEFKSWFNKGKREGVCKTVLKNKLNNITFTETFPSHQVVEAYLNPKVETSKETFSWTKPDIIALSIFAKAKFGWSSKKTDEILNPVVKRLEESHSQKSIRDYFKTKIKVRSGPLEGKISKRVKSALGQFGKTREDLISEEIEHLEKQQKKTRTKTKLSTEEKSKQKIDRKNKRARKSAEESGTDKEIKKNISQSKGSEPNNKSKDTENNQEFKQNNEKKDITKSQESEEINSKLEQPKRTRKRNNNKIEETKPTKIRDIDEPQLQINEPNLMDTEDIKTDDAVDELKLYEGLAAELKIRRQKKNELQSKNKQTRWQKQKKPKKNLESIPEELKEHEDVQVLIATTSKSVQRVQEINKEVEENLLKSLKQIPEPVSNTNMLRKIHNKEIIHQKLRDNTDLLRNKMKAIEVFRRSKKGPGFVEKRQRARRRPKQDAGLSEDSDG